ncbi:MAG: DUF6089 family protein [Vicingaceae bacterium]
MKFKLTTIPLFFILISSAYSQHSEVGITLGTSYYIGEINPAMHIVNKVRPSAGVFYRKNSNKRYSLRAGFNYASIAASDAISSSELSIYRDVSFSANLYEAYGILEFNFIPYQINNFRASKFSPYVFIGVAMFYNQINIDNKAKGLTNEIIEDITEPAIPFGVGIKFNFVENLGLGIEWGMRKTFTDKFDGLSATSNDDYQLSSTQNKDWYSIFGITLNYKFLTKRDRCPGAIN